MNKGIFCISIDTELLWGRKDLNYNNLIPLVKKERTIIKKLISLFDKYDIPVTWAIVGKLEEGNDPLWSGKDILKWIKTNKTHEIASHSYSHEDFSKIGKNIADKEFSKYKKFSFIFPRNHINYLDLLKKNGFKAYRGKDESEYELLIPRVPPTAKAKKINGLIIVPSSMYYVSARGIRKYIPFGVRLIKSKLGINKAIKRNEIYHLWFHPIDLVVNSNLLLKELEEILKYADNKRVENKLQIMTMGEIAKSV